MRWPSIESVLLLVFGFVFLIAGGYLITQTPSIASEYGRQRLLIAGLIAVVLSGVFLYKGLAS
jgi:uncharacterized membrane protein HdeD (DUF308 family)